MKTLFTSVMGIAFTMGAFAQEITLPQGMIKLLPDGTEITSSYLSQNIVSITKDEKPFVVADDNKMYFTATNAQSGDELWISDGTPSGTHILKDIVPGSDGSDPKWLTVVGNLVYFSAKTSAEGAELWVTDGTEAGTHLVKDIYEGETGSEPQGLTNLYGKLLFFAMDEESEAIPVCTTDVPEKWLWVSDGTPEGTKRIGDTPTRLDNMDGTCGYIVTANGKGMFAGYDIENNETLWVTDGTSEGTKPLMNINPRVADGNPFKTEPATIDHLVSVDDRLVVFRANVVKELYDMDCGVEMWISDGTTEGTKWIGLDINKVESKGVPGGSDFRQTYAFDNMLYFRATDGINGAEAWSFDIDKPIQEGVNPRLVKEVAHYKGKVSYNAHPSCFYRYKGYIYTATKYSYSIVNPDSPTETYTWEAGYHCFARFNENNYDEYEGSYYWCGFELAPAGVSQWCHQFTTVNDIMFWSCQDQENNIELWKMEGTNGTPTKVVDFPDNGQVHKTRSVANSLYFMSNTQKQLYRYNTDGSTVYGPTTELVSNENKQLVVYPMLTKDVVNIHSDKQIKGISLWNLSGEKVKSVKGECSMIDIRNLTEGIYMLNVAFEDGTRAVRKIIKQ